MTTSVIFDNLFGFPEVEVVVVWYNRTKPEHFSFLIVIERRWGG